MFFCDLSLPAEASFPPLFPAALRPFLWSITPGNTSIYGISHLLIPLLLSMSASDTCFRVWHFSWSLFLWCVNHRRCPVNLIFCPADASFLWPVFLPNDSFLWCIMPWWRLFSVSIIACRYRLFGSSLLQKCLYCGLSLVALTSRLWSMSFADASFLWPTLYSDT